MRKVALPQELRNEAATDTKELLGVLLTKNGGQNGYSFEDMLAIMPIKRKIDDADKHFVLLEEAEFSLLEKQIRSFRFGVIDVYVTEFLQEVLATVQSDLALAVE